MSLPCRALPCRALPRRALPCRALYLIREYSKPLTRPDWRHSKPIITTFRLYLLIKYVMYIPIISPTKRLHSMILYNIGDTEYTDHRMLKADGIEDAICHHRWV